MCYSMTRTYTSGCYKSDIVVCTYVVINNHSLCQSLTRPVLTHLLKKTKREQKTKLLVARQFYTTIKMM
jgi:hypothetical protein